MNTNFSVGEIIKEIVIALGLDVAVRKFTEVHGPEVAKHVIERVTDRVRNNLFVFIRGMKNQVASKNLLKWHESCKGTAGEEDRWVNIMGALYLAVKDDPKKWWIFEDLGTIKNKKDREQALYFLENDVVKQWFDKFKEVMGEFLRVLRRYYPMSMRIWMILSFGSVRISGSLEPGISERNSTVSSQRITSRFPRERGFGDPSWTI